METAPKLFRSQELPGLVAEAAAGRSILVADGAMGAMAMAWHGVTGLNKGSNQFRTNQFIIIALINIVH